MAPIKLIYDSNCPLCRASVAKIQRLDKIGLVQSIPISDPDLPKSAPPRDELIKELHVIMPDGAIFKGADAVAKLAALFPQTRWLGVLIGLPVIRSIARVVYRLVAANRMRLFSISE